VRVPEIASVGVFSSGSNDAIGNLWRSDIMPEVRLKECILSSRVRRLETTVDDAVSNRNGSAAGLSN
jgi:hypothetical protein